MTHRRNLRRASGGTPEVRRSGFAAAEARGLQDVTQGKPRTVLLVSADAADILAIRQALAQVPGYEVVLEVLDRCADAVMRLGQVSTAPVAAVLVDLHVPDNRGIETQEALMLVAPQVPIVVRCLARDEALARQWMERGAEDFLPQETGDGPWIVRAIGSALLRAACAQERRLLSDRARITLDSIGDAVVSTDAAGNVTYLNPVGEGMTGWTLQAAVGQPLTAVLRIVDADSRVPAPNPLLQAMIRNRPVGLSPNSVLLRRDGHEVPIEDTAAPIHDAAGGVAGAVIVFHDVSAARTNARRMSHLAHHDALTGLPNRLLLHDRLMGSIAMARRHRKALAVLFLDVNHFKHVNDTLGHTVGDALLRSLARRLVGCVRSSDTVSRQGGDEFVVLLAEVAHAEDAKLCAQKIHAAMRLPHSIEGRELTMTVSIGIGVYPEDGKDARTLLRNADLALIQSRAAQSAERRPQALETNQSTIAQLL